VLRQKQGKQIHVEEYDGQMSHMQPGWQILTITHYQAKNTTHSKKYKMLHINRKQRVTQV
jgi:hypothetical protein